MSDTEMAIQKLEKESAGHTEEYTSTLLSHLKTMAADMPEIFLQEEKSFKGCLEFVYSRLQFQALQNCLKEKNYTALSNGAGTYLHIEKDGIFELAENYYFLSDEDIKASAHDDEFQELMKQLSKECREKQATKNTVQKTVNKPDTVRTQNYRNNTIEDNDFCHEQVSIFD